MIIVPMGDHPGVNSAALLKDLVNFWNHRFDPKLHWVRKHDAAVNHKKLAAADVRGHVHAEFTTSSKWNDADRVLIFRD